MQNFLTQIRNALLVDRTEVKVPYTKLNLATAEAMVRTGYLKAIQKKGRGYRRFLILEFRPDKKVINEIVLVSRPSRRVYRGYGEIRRFKQGYGNYFVSTPNGILTDAEARRAKVGGEILFSIW